MESQNLFVIKNEYIHPIYSNTFDNRQKNYNHLESNKKKIKNIVSAKIQED